MLDVSTLAPKLQTFFTQTAQAVAQTSGFVTRTSKLTGALFLQVLTFGFLSNPRASLTDLLETSHELGVTITKQGLQTRLEEAAPFLQAMFQHGLTLFRNTLRLDLKALQSFSAIYLTDSLSIAPPAESAVLVREGSIVVMAVVGGVISYKRVQPGVRFSGKVEIIQGITPEDSIVVSGRSEITEGTSVTIMSSPS